MITSPGSARCSPPTLSEARQTLNRVWQYPDFRYHQRKAVVAVLRGRDSLAVLPTGGGKSLCFQVPALVLPGMTLVVSPLISLMQDQVLALRARGIPAAYLSSTQTVPEQRTVRAALAAQRLKLLYVAPERMPEIVRTFPRGMVSRLAIDEAHCISEWGHDFRPHYRALGRHRAALGSPPTMAVTATATPAALQDLAMVLRLRRPVRIAQSFDRPNLFLAANRVVNERQRFWRLAHVLRQTRGAAIVYTTTRNRTDGTASILERWGVNAQPYHAGLPAPARSVLLERFMAGHIDVMVATNAFGMGIDKPDIRLVVHLGVPNRPEAYFQEAGRAGRDGGPARCEMMWTLGDLAFASRMEAVSASGSAKHRAARRLGLRTMRRYARTRRCRREVLLEYLGERVERCGGCDRCEGGGRERCAVPVGPVTTAHFS